MYNVVKALVIACLFLSGCPKMDNVQNVQHNENDEIIVVIGTEWCAACKVLQRKIQVNREIVSIIQTYYKDKFYVVDAENEQYKDWVKDANVESYPTVIKFKYENGGLTELDRFVGADISYNRIKQFLGVSSQPQTPPPFCPGGT